MYKHIEEFLKFNPNMKNEEIPENIVDFCEYIIQQSTGMSEDFFKNRPQVVEEFLENFKDGKGKLFYRGGYPNLDRTILCASKSIRVAENFAIRGHNYKDGTILDGCTNTVYVLKAEKYHKTLCNVDNEEEVLLWKPVIVSNYKVTPTKTNIFKRKFI